MLCIYSDIINFFNVFFSSIKFKDEIKKSETFFNFCNDNINMLKKFKKIKNPKVSVVSPVHNREIFLRRFLKSIQHQNFDHIEIIFVDDKSSDNSVNILKEYQKVDKRIKIIKHKRNKGTFISRNIGVLYSQAKYLILPDPDDIISKDIISTCLYYAEKYKFEIIRFYAYTGNKKQDIKFVNKIESRPVYQPELQTYLFYGNNKLGKVDSGINRILKANKK
jgi:glycosyltransferase involved in cell wall biosynthesis